MKDQNTLSGDPDKVLKVLDFPIKDRKSKISYINNNIAQDYYSKIEALRKDIFDVSHRACQYNKDQDYYFSLERAITQRMSVYKLALYFSIRPEGIIVNDVINDNIIAAEKRYFDKVVECIDTLNTLREQVIQLKERVANNSKLSFQEMFKNNDEFNFCLEILRDVFFLNDENKPIKKNNKIGAALAGVLVAMKEKR